MTDSFGLNNDLGTTDILWNLEHLYHGIDHPDIEEDIRFCREETKRLVERYQGNVSSLSSIELKTCLSLLENLHVRLSRLSTYAFLKYITQVKDDEKSAFQQKIRELVSSVEAQLIFFDLEWNELPEDKAQQHLQDTAISSYRHYLKSMRRYRPHLLDREQEKLLLERKVVGRSSWTTLFEKVFGNLSFGEQNRTEEEVLTDLYSRDRETRKKAAEEMTTGLKGSLHILTHIFNTLASEKMITDRQRRYPSWISTMNLENQINDDTVEHLVTAVTDRYDIVQGYYSVKKEIHGYKELFDYDRYAPLPDLPTRRIRWPEAQDIVLESFAEFSPVMADIARGFFDNRYIHAPILAGKRGGAFAHPCVPQAHPYVLVNYSGTLRDISTLAHELGHGVHMVLAAEKGYFNSDTPLVLAETASVFAELLVFQAQMELISNPSEQQAFLCQKIESIFATVFRQTAMNRFEALMHEQRRESGELSCEQLNSFWLSSQQKMFGDAVTLTDNYKIWWAYIPHFLSTPGYVYSYAFGELLVLEKIMKIVLLDGYTINPGDLNWAAFEELGNLQVYDRTPAEQVVQRSKEAQIVLTNKTVLSGEILQQLEHLKYIGVLATGYNVVDIEAARRMGIVVTNVPVYGAQSVAQMVFAHILNVTNTVSLHVEDVKSGGWAKTEDFCYWLSPQQELAGKNLGIFGFGQIGQTVAQIGRAFGMRVLIHTRSKPTDFFDQDRLVDKDELFCESDFLSLHCPLTTETEKCVNRETLALMKKSAVLINTSRGQLIDEFALADALNNENLAAACLDVLCKEPADTKSPLLAAKNCHITPHIAWASREARMRLVASAAATLKSFLA
ncbi:unnamed protein product, partial [Cyprideis torosa]